MPEVENELGNESGHGMDIGVTWIERFNSLSNISST